MNDSTSVGKRVQNLQISPEFNTYTMVIIHAGQITDESGNTTDLDYIAGNTGGRTLEIKDPMGTQAKANALLAKLQNSKWQYQPYTGDKALLDPAAELGDGLTISDTFSAIYRRKVRFSSLMAADLEAPSDEEVDHEYPYIPIEERAYKRETQFTRTQLKINANSIVSEVQERKQAITGLDTKLTSKIEQTAQAISAEVSRVDSKNLDHTYENTSFGWKLTSNGFYLNSNGNKNVFTCTKDGIVIQGNATVTGKIQATSGYIGNDSTGFKITGAAIYNTKDGLENGKNGVYIGRDGISLGAVNGASAFKVTSSGAVTARNMAIVGGSIDMKDSNGNLAFRVTSGGDVTARNITLRGQLKMQNADGGNQKLISADTLATYASNGNSANSWLNADVGGGVSRGNYCVSGAGSGITAKGKWDNAENSQIGVTIYGAFYGSVHASGGLYLPFGYGSKQVYLKQETFHDGDTISYVTF